ncbi:MAG: response regulator [Nitrospirales bacterium]|nr:response regulator [Nitrospirales bacterium]
MNKKRILIVDDEVIQTMALEDVLTLWEYEICEPVVSGEKAVGAVKREKPDLVLMDINIQGGRSGIEVAEQIISELNIPVIFLTGYSDNEIYEKAKALNPAGYLIKPFELEDLRLAIEAASVRDSSIFKSEQKQF